MPRTILLWECSSPGDVVNVARGVAEGDQCIDLSTNTLYTVDGFGQAVQIGAGNIDAQLQQVLGNSQGFQQAGAGSVLRTFQAKGQDIVSILDFGADPTGTLDSGPALRAACAYAAAVGGCIIQHPKGLYRYASTNGTDWPKQEYCIATLPSNTTLHGDPGTQFWIDGATLHSLAPFNAGSRFNGVAMAQSGTNCHVKGINFTTNGWTLDIAFRTCNGVIVGSSNSTVEQCSFVNMPGRNMVTVGYNNASWPTYQALPTGVVIRENFFHNGGTAVSGNTIATDCSFVYCNGYGVTVKDNVFINDTMQTVNTGGVELHGSGMSVKDNTFTNLKPGVYTGWQFTTPTVSVANSVKDNRFTGCAGGVQTIDTSEGLDISYNEFINCCAASSSQSYGFPIYSSLNSGTGVSSGIQSGTQITGNYFREDTPILYETIFVAGLNNALVARNRFDGISAPIFISGASDTVTNNVLVCDNQSVNSLLTPSFNTAIVQVGGSDSWASTVSNVVIKDNQITCASGTTNTYAAIATGMDTTFANVRIKGTYGKFINDSVAGTMAASVMYEQNSWAVSTPAWTQASGTQPALGNGSVSLAWRRQGNEVFCKFNFAAGSTSTFGNNATAYLFALPLPASSTLTQVAVMAITDGVSALDMVRLLIGASATTFNMQYNGQSVRLNWPFTSVTTMTIQGEFSYLVDPI